MLRATDSGEDFYGRDYWFTHVNDLAQPDITERARADLIERCVHWLRVFLRYQQPPARVLELGCGHGGFLALLQRLGFEVTGLELSPWVVDYARRSFDIPMLLGPLEDQRIDDSSLDAIVLMDVLEHLPDPVGTMRVALRLLKPDGLLLIQTPRAPERASHAELVASGDRFLSQLKPYEHLYLLAESSLRRLFGDLGAEYVTFEPAMFPWYDMFAVVSRARQVGSAWSDVERRLLSSSAGRLTLALVDASDKARDMESRLAESERDRGARLDAINLLEAQLAQSEQDRAARLDSMKRLEALLAESEADRAARLVVIEDQSRRLAETRSELGRAQQEIARVTLLRSGAGAEKTVNPSARPLTRVDIDLTPLLVGGANGGARLVALSMLPHLSRLAPEVHFTLLTNDLNHASLAHLDSPNMSRQLLGLRSAPAVPVAVAPYRRMLARIHRRADRFVPGRLKPLVPRAAVNAPPPVQRESDDEAATPDVVFCPFTAPHAYDPRIPLVSTIHDLQYIYHPNFFSAAERVERGRTFGSACRLADRLVCVSEYVRSTVLGNGDIAPDRVITIPLGLLQDLPRPLPEQTAHVLTELNVRAGQYLLFPSNFWSHKNHRMLLTALGMYFARHRHSALQIVCTGTPDGQMEEIRRAACGMHLDHAVMLPGFVSDEQLAALYQGCLAVIFPSLYEGFGMPVLEAMAFNKPVLCSNITSLPEVVGDAALTFDPRKPEEIVNAIEHIELEPDLAVDLMHRGQARAGMFGGSRELAERYLQVFRDVLAEGKRQLADGMHGIHNDGWIGDRALISHARADRPRVLELQLNAPDWSPSSSTTVIVEGKAANLHRQYAIPRGERLLIREVLPATGGVIELFVSPALAPSSLGFSSDGRELGCLCDVARLLTGEASVDLKSLNDA
ncbi:MAG: glycosyltransferase [Chloroflexi bacterium]|nr:glycosyltransferase [Chloroflexota bacterium]